MANRFFQQFRYSLEKNVVDLFCDVTVGATGAPTKVVSKLKRYFNSGKKLCR
jgi:hypothetical protein